MSPNEIDSAAMGAIRNATLPSKVSSTWSGNRDALALVEQILKARRKLQTAQAEFDSVTLYDGSDSE